MQLFNTSQGFCAENNSLQNLASPRFYYFSFISEQLVRVFVHPLPSRPWGEFGRKPLPTPREPPPLVVGVKEQPSPLETGTKQKNPKLRAPSRQVKVQDAPLPVASSGKGREPEPSAQQTPAPHPCPFRRLLFFFSPFFFFFSPPSADQSRKFS